MTEKVLEHQFGSGPLKVDDAYRGKYAVHVKSHRKIGTHRTILIDAIPLINEVMREHAVWRVVLGRIVKPSQKPYRRIIVKLTQRTLEIVIENLHRVQYITIEICQLGGHQLIAEKIIACGEKNQFKAFIRTKLPRHY